MQASEKLAAVKKEIKDLVQLRKAAADVSRLHAEVEQLSKEIERIEQDLASTGSNRTVNDVQREVDVINTEQYVAASFPCDCIDLNIP
jgi:predicted  nucleic acid-binding Zn-ribbon protein